MASSTNHLDDPSAAASSSYSSYFPSPVRSAVGSVLRRLSSDTFLSKSTNPPSQPQTPARKASRQDSFGEFQEYQEGNLIDLSDEETSAATTITSAAKHQPSPPQPQPSSATKPAPSHLHPPSPAVFTPATRSITPPPFQPPPLASLTLHGTSSSSQILSTLLAEEIRLLMPARLQLVDAWKLAFSLERDGSSLATLYDKSAAFSGRRGAFVLVVMDSARNVFGAYLSDPPHPSKGHYYGTGECFLWRCSVLRADATLSLASLPPPPSADTSHATRMTTLASPPSSFSAGASGLQLQEQQRVNGNGGAAGSAVNSGDSTPERIRFTAFPYSGINDYMIFCEHQFLSVGGGDGHYGLWLDGSLENGVSSSCPTFGNEPLSGEGTKFEVLDVEVWYLGA